MLPERRRGFTLIELLVVIAIIAILAAILFPVFAKARESAKRTTCLNNMRQIGVSIMMYVDDNGGKYPAYPQGSCPPGISSSKFDSVGSMATGLIWTLRNYGKYSKIWVCPSGGMRKYHSSTYDNPKGEPTSGRVPLVGWIEDPALGGAVFTNYSAYAFNQHANLPIGQHPPREQDLLCARGKTPSDFYDECTHDGYQPWLVHDSYDMQDGKRFYPHKGGICGTFWDGHAKWVRDNRFNDAD